MASTHDVAKIDLLIVDGNDRRRAETAHFFSQHGCSVEQSDNGEQALAIISRQAIDVVILDRSIPKLPGFDSLDGHLQAHDAECEVVLLVDEKTRTISTTEREQDGYDYLTKPIRHEELLRRVQRAYKNKRRKTENYRLKFLLHHQLKTVAIIGESTPLNEVRRQMDRIAPTNAPVLIQGESGTGKNTVARLLHRASRLGNKPLVAVHCASHPDDELENELFGREEETPSFSRSTPGLLEMANEGTLLLSEVSTISPSLQAKLLRVLEDGTVRRIGSAKRRRVNIRLIATTSRDIAQEVTSGRFRKDLFYRINGLTIDLPPLRARSGDIRLLAKHFCGEERHITESATRVLEQYRWPGNVRQLRDVLLCAQYLAEGDSIHIEHLPPRIISSDRTRNGSHAGPETSLDLLNRRHIAEIFRRNKGNKARTAQALGVGRRTLYRLLEKYEIHSNL